MDPKLGMYVLAVLTHRIIPVIKEVFHVVLWFREHLREDFGQSRNGSEVVSLQIGQLPARRLDSVGSHRRWILVIVGVYTR